MGVLRATETEKERDRKCNRETEKGEWGEMGQGETETERERRTDRLTEIIF